MAETKRTTPSGGVESGEEIVEKKPTAPVAVALLIIATVAIGFTIYLELDWLDGFFSPDDYQQNRTPDSHFDNFRKKLRKEEEGKPEWFLRELGKR
ncbi:MAG: hypothetical protein N2234_05555 [Planctomycetota bacterium]|nr:hypothetical protein [Planctomycetota bacterium]